MLHFWRIGRLCLMLGLHLEPHGGMQASNGAGRSLACCMLLRASAAHSFSAVREARAGTAHLASIHSADRGAAAVQDPERRTEGDSPPGAGCLVFELDSTRARLRACETELDDIADKNAFLKIDNRALMRNAAVSMVAHVRTPRQPLATLVCGQCEHCFQRPGVRCGQRASSAHAVRARAALHG